MTHRFLLAALALGLAAPAAYAQPHAHGAGHTPTTLEDPALVQRYQATITADELAGLLYVYASDHFQGRDTGTPGQHLAALWLGGQYQAMGVAPHGSFRPEHPRDPRAYFQPFQLGRQSTGQLFPLPSQDEGDAAAASPDGRVDTENVVAFVEGSDPALRDEFVVVSAHLDHVGTDPSQAGDPIFNGADDDGTGNVSLLEIAEAFQRAKDEGHGPRRSVLFLHVTGEEHGLFGSAYYADVEPLVPLANTVANLNIDMIGRADPDDPEAPDSNYVYIIGGDLISQDLHDWNAAVNTATGINLRLSARFNSPTDPNQFFRRSDHWNFGKHRIPFIFYFTGVHADYHGVDDEPDRIDYPRLAQRARLIFGTAWEIANRDQRPAVSGAGFN